MKEEMVRYWYGMILFAAIDEEPFHLSHLQILCLCIEESIVHHKISASTLLKYGNYEIPLVHNLF